MSETVIKIYAVQGLFLFVQEENLSPEALENWKEHGIKAALAVPGMDCTGNGPGGKYQPFTDVCLSAGKDTELTAEEVSRLLASAVKKLKLPAERTVVISDHPAMIGAAREKEFAMQIGLAGEGSARRPFYDQGAHLTVENLREVALYEEGLHELGFSQSIPGVFEAYSDLRMMFGKRKPVFFFDYDGTLSPIVSDPAEAVMTEGMQELLNDLARKFRVAVISGRDMDDVKKFVGLDNIIYAGSHGFRIAGPDGLFMEQEQAKKLRPRLDEMEKKFRETLEKQIRGVQVERKRYAIAIHYRNAPDHAPEEIHRQLETLLAGDPEFTTGTGKKIVEVKPSLDWHKGKAVEWIMQELGLAGSAGHVAVYVGDDITDEDAFRTLADDGIGILVGEHDQPSAARYRLRDTEQVKQFVYYLKSVWFDKT
ncbi:MAG TPA: trehalose-phosphatase [Bacteroidetes bacterium]|nr:trehalose-phosphatase [Bacteroidota bacterium]